MAKNQKSIGASIFGTKWIALEKDKVIAEGVDISEVYVKAMYIAKSKPQFKRVPYDFDSQIA